METFHMHVEQLQSQSSPISIATREHLLTILDCLTSLQHYPLKWETPNISSYQLKPKRKRPCCSGRRARLLVLQFTILCMMDSMAGHTRQTDYKLLNMVITCLICLPGELQLKELRRRVRSHPLYAKACTLTGTISKLKRGMGRVIKEIRKIEGRRKRNRKL